MTRFARSKGSSSAARSPHHATPWSVMKQQGQGASSSMNENDSDSDIDMNENERELEFDNENSTQWAEFNEKVDNKVLKKQKKDASHVGKALKGKRNMAQLNTDDSEEHEMQKQHKKKRKSRNSSDGNESSPDISHKKSENDNNCQEDKGRVRRKEIPKSIIVNDREIKIALFGGIPLKEEDVIQLKALQKNMEQMGNSEEEIKATMKRERRRAERNFKKEKRNKCGKCHKDGHVSANCPEANEQTETSRCPEVNKQIKAKEICYNCGLAGHKAFMCKVAKDNRVRSIGKEGKKGFKCFTCGEEGHTSRKCPDNPRGVYPEGKSCKFCGEVTHLKKDCPKLIQKKASREVTVETIGSSVDALEEAPKPLPKFKKQKKIVKF